MKSVFNKLKKGMKIKDLGYGEGIVIKKLKTRVDIQLNNGKLWRYDIPHVNRFVKIKGNSK